MQQLVRRLPGVVSTRVGYSGGDVQNATYRNHGTHAEAIEITRNGVNCSRPSKGVDFFTLAATPIGGSRPFCGFWAVAHCYPKPNRVRGQAALQTWANVHD